MLEARTDTINEELNVAPVVINGVIPNNPETMDTTPAKPPRKAKGKTKTVEEADNAKAKSSYLLLPEELIKKHGVEESGVPVALADVVKTGNLALVRYAVLTPQISYTEA